MADKKTSAWPAAGVAARPSRLALVDATFRLRRLAVSHGLLPFFVSLPPLCCRQMCASAAHHTLWRVKGPTPATMRLNLVCQIGPRRLPLRCAPFVKAGPRGMALDRDGRDSLMVLSKVCSRCVHAQHMPRVSSCEATCTMTGSFMSAPAAASAWSSPPREDWQGSKSIGTGPQAAARRRPSASLTTTAQPARHGAFHMAPATLSSYSTKLGTLFRSGGKTAVVCFTSFACSEAPLN